MAYYGKGTSKQVLTENTTPKMSSWQTAASIGAVTTLSDDVGTKAIPDGTGNIQLVGHVVEQGSTKFSTTVQGTNLVNINPMSASRWIVDPLGFNGTHTTIASAITSSTSGDTIFLMPGTYTENPTMKAGVNLTAYESDSSLDGTGKVIISGTCTLTTAGTVTLSGIQLQTNSAFLLAVTGSAASIVNLNNCYIKCTNNTGISFTSSSASARIKMWNCPGDITTTGIALFAHSSAGFMDVSKCAFTNSGASTTANTISAGEIFFANSVLSNPLTSSGTAQVAIGPHSVIDTQGQNVTAFTSGGSGSHAATLSSFASGSASAISVSNTLSCNLISVDSSNATSAISGAGSISNSGIGFSNTGNNIAPTQLGRVFNYTYARSQKQPGFLAYLNTQDSSITGNGITYTLGSGNALTKAFDQNGDLNTNGTFTAPITGRYFFQYCQAFGALTSAMTSSVFRINTTANIFDLGNFNIGAVMTSTNIYIFTGSIYCNMTAGDTATFTSIVANGAGNVVNSLAPSSGLRTYISGFMLC